MSSTNNNSDTNLTSAFDGDQLDRSNCDLIVDPIFRHAFVGYEILRPVGRGAMGVVYEAYEVDLKRRVALKVLQTAALMDHQRVERFKNEAQAVAQLSHPNIVPVYKVNTASTIHFFTMPLIQGQNLAQVVRSIKESLSKPASKNSTDALHIGSTSAEVGEIKAPNSLASNIKPNRASTSPTKPRRHFNPDEFRSSWSRADRSLFMAIAELGADIADGLAHAHDRGIIHRDIKPSNIMIDKEGKGWLTDFGLAQVRDVPSATQTGDVVGTLRYMSPEQASGRRYLVDHRTDIYSLGLTLYELITLQHAFSAEEKQQLLRKVHFEEPQRIKVHNPAVPSELEIIISKAIAKNPLERYESAAVFADDLRRFASGFPILARPVSWSLLAQRWLIRHKTTSAAMAIIFLSTFLITAVAAGLIHKAFLIADTEREKLALSLKESEGLRMGLLSQQAKNPGLAMAFAVKSGLLTSGLEVNAAAAKALATNRERKTIQRDRVDEMIDVSPDGKYAVACARAIDARFTPAVLIHLTDGESRILDQNRSISSAVFHPSGNKLLAASSLGFTRTQSGDWEHRSNSASLLNLNTNESVVSFAESTLAYATSDCFADDGRLVVLPCNNNAVAVYRSDTGERLIAFREHKSQVMQATATRDGKLAASIDADGQVIIWEANSATLRKKFTTTSKFQSHTRIAFSASGERLIVADNAKTIVYAASGDSTEPMARWREPRFAINPLFDRVACYRDAGEKLVVRDIASGLSVAECRLPAGELKVRWSNDGRQLVMSVGTTAQIMDESLYGVQAEFVGHDRAITDFAIANPSLIVTASKDQTLRAWSPKTEIERRATDIETYGALPTRSNTDFHEGWMATGTAAEFQTFTMSVDRPNPIPLTTGRVRESNYNERLVAFERHSVRLIDGHTNKKYAEIRIPGNSPIEDAILCADTDRVLVISHDGSARIWNADQQRIQKFEGLAETVSGWAVSSDGSQIAIGTQGRKCQIFNSDSGKLVSELIHDGPVTCVEFLDGNEHLATIEDQRWIRIWQGSPLEVKHVFSNSGTRFSDLKFSKSRKLLIAYNLKFEGKICSWSLDTRKLFASIDVDATTSCAYQDELPALAIASLRSGLRLWNPIDGALRSLSPDATSSVAFVNQTLVAAQSGPQVRLQKSPANSADLNGSACLKLFDSSTGELARTIGLPHEPVRLSVNSSAPRFALSALSWSVVISQPGKKTENSISFSAPINVVQRIANTGRWAVGSNDGRAVILENDGKLFREFPIGNNPITAGSVSLDGQLFATGDLRGQLVVWDIKEGKHVQRLETGGGNVRALEFDPTGLFLVAATDDMKLHRLDVRTGQMQTLEIARGIRSVQLINQGRRAFVVTGSDQWLGSGRPTDTYVADQVKGKAVMVSFEPAFSLREFNRPDVVLSGAVNKSHTTIAVVTQDKNVMLLDAETHDVRKEMELENVIAVAFSPENDTLAILNDKGIQLWDTAKDERIWSIDLSTRTRFGEDMERFTWNPFVAGGKEVVTIGTNIQRWPVNLQEIVTQMAPRTLTHQEIREYRIDRFENRSGNP